MWWARCLFGSYGLVKWYERQFTDYLELSIYRTMDQGLKTVNLVSQILEYLVYGHSAWWYEN